MKKFYIKAGKENLAAIIFSNKTTPNILLFHGGGLKKRKIKHEIIKRNN